MRHQKHTFKVGRTGAHNRAMIANMLKSLIENERIETTVTKAKELRRHADRIITLAKANSLASRRGAISKLRIQFNPLSSKNQRKAKEGNFRSYNSDRKVMDKLFAVLGPRFTNRMGGYTRIIKKGERVGDCAPMCIIEYLQN
jgi:large subunit ribosomal protein L17